MSPITSFAPAVMAAKPVKTVYIEDIVNGDEIFTVFAVECSDGSKKEVSSWNDGAEWCRDRVKDKCVKKKIKIAKNACR